MMKRILLNLTLLASLLLGCCVTDPSGNPPATEEALPLGGIVFQFNSGRSGDSWIDWIAPDGSGRQTVFKNEWEILGTPYAAKFPFKHAATVANTSVGDSLFIYNMTSRRSTFIHAFPWGSYSGMVLSPNGSMIAYYSYSEWDGNVSNLRIAEVDGTGSRVLVSNAWVENTPSFSPDGRKIAYCESILGYSQLHIVDISSGVNSVIIDSAAQYMGVPVSWSPDGTHVLFTRTSPNGEFSIWEAGVDGSKMQRLTPPGIQEMDPQWSPDGSQIICSSGSLRVSQNIVLMNSDGTGRRQLTAMTDVVNDNARWSPDGARITYRSYILGAGDHFSFLYILDVSTGSVRELAAASIIRSSFWDYTK